MKDRPEISLPYSPVFKHTGFFITLQQAWAAPKPSTLHLINNRSETVWVAISNWDFDRNTQFTKGWYAVKPNSSITIPVGPNLDYERSIYLYAKSNTHVWEGTLAELGECDDRVTERVVRTDTKFEYWGKGGWQQSWKDWKRCLFISTNSDENGNFTYTFD
ncbi:hypothetical protein SPSIL_038640 [Sporomusa silvacetica DSM 10669]|uniref:Uncharacterized protein n=1 Tax=Sporomusa silvacetica DSM 10669 TaxID=1123289 RepID=A0ABZ3IPL3_9FIRM|nr:DUF1036 domain-containing protein [Sporomusa silvacetica]OZC23445.1 hypothetical protein SPSIL_02270 [Sporomusa silvacetica DSM 10669]